MITATELWAFIKAFPAFVGFLKNAYGDFKELQMRMIDKAHDEKIKELETQIARLKNAQTNEDIGSIITSINRG